MKDCLAKTFIYFLFNEVYLQTSLWGSYYYWFLQLNLFKEEDQQVWFSFWSRWLQ